MIYDGNKPVTIYIVSAKRGSEDDAVDYTVKAFALHKRADDFRIRCQLIGDEIWGKHREDYRGFSRDNYKDPKWHDVFMKWNRLTAVRHPDTIHELDDCFDIYGETEYYIEELDFDPAME